MNRVKIIQKKIKYKCGCVHLRDILDVENSKTELVAKFTQCAKCFEKDDDKESWISVADRIRENKLPSLPDCLKANLAYTLYLSRFFEYRTLKNINFEKRNIAIGQKKKLDNLIKNFYKENIY